MNEEFSSRSLLRAPWREVAKCYRQICWLHSEGRDDEAQLINDTEFASALARANAIAAVPPAPAQLQAALEREADRVACAVATLELLAPVLKANRTVAFAAATDARTDPAPISRKTQPGDEMPSVADFIEDMLSQERGPRG